MRFRATLLVGIVLISTPVHAQFLASGTPTITLSMSSAAGAPMNVAWHPVFQQYYGGGGGSPSLSGRVWDASGNVVQTRTPINDDLRGFYYNPGTANLEEVAFGSRTGSGNPNAGIKRVGLDGAGLYTGVFATLINPVPGVADNQSVVAFDAGRNVLYSQGLGTGVVLVADRATGLLLNTIALDLVDAGNPSIFSVSLGYDPQSDAFIEFTTTGGNRALAFSATTGDFLASISLPGLLDPNSFYSPSYTNGQFFVFDNGINAYRGYVIDAAVPEPSAFVALALASLSGGIALRRRLLRRANPIAEPSRPRATG